MDMVYKDPRWPWKGEAVKFLLRGWKEEMGFCVFWYVLLHACMRACMCACMLFGRLWRSKI